MMLFGHISREFSPKGVIPLPVEIVEVAHPIIQPAVELLGGSNIIAPEPSLDMNDALHIFSFNNLVEILDNAGERVS